MCAGDKVPYTDEKKVMEYDDKMYARAKQAQMIMASMKKKQKEYDSLWDKEGVEYDPEGVADNTEAQGCQISHHRTETVRIQVKQYQIVNN